MNKLLKDKLGDNIKENQIKEHTVMQRLFGNPPDGIDQQKFDDNIYVV